MATIYQINKGINKPIEFKGLKAQYIFYLGLGLVILLLWFAILYVLGVNLVICLMLVGSLGTGLFMMVYKLSHQYGEHGLTKLLAKNKIPEFLKATTRSLFTNLSTDELLVKRKEVDDGQSN